jgi:putative ABC transport system permease protein
MVTIWHDIRYGLRVMLKKPALSVVAVLSLALGIGAVTTMASVFWSVVLCPLPFPESDRLVFVQAVTDQGNPNSLSALDYFDYREQCDTFEALAAQAVFQEGQLVTGLGEAERVMSIAVSHNFFNTLGYRPLHGRSFVKDDEMQGGPQAVVASHGFWQRRLDGDLSVLGNPLTIGGTSFAIVGIMPPDFDYPRGVDLWFPMQQDGWGETGRSNNNFFIIGRLAAGVTLEQTQSQMDVVARQISEAYPDDKGGWGVVITPLQEQFFGNLKPLMWTLTGATLFLLLIACSNVSSLVLARVLDRRSELAIRQSFGAFSGRITRQLLIESILLIAMAALGGIVLAHYGIRRLKILAPAGLPRVQTIAIEPVVLLWTLGGTALSALAFTLVPAWRGSRVSPVSTLREGRLSSCGVCGMRLRKLLVATQVALSLALLIGSGLLLRSLYRLQQVDTGMQPDGLLTIDVQLPETDNTAGNTHPFVPMVETLRELPGVQAAAAADELPFFGGRWIGLYRADRPAQTASDRLPATCRFVTQGYFSTMGIPLLAGRDFRPTDTQDSANAVLISKAFAERLFPNENPLGKTIVMGLSEGPSWETIGIVNDVRDFGLAANNRPAVYLAYQQHPYPPATIRLVVRADGDPEALVAPIRAVMNENYRDAALFRIGTMEGWIANTTANNRFTSLLCSTFAVAALCLVITGLYGLLTTTVTRRTTEIGVRLALGGTPGMIARRILWETCRLVGLGIVGGIGVALGVTPFIRSQFFGIESYDPLTILGAAILLLTCAVLAAWLPARRAAKIDPMEALRYE